MSSEGTVNTNGAPFDEKLPAPAPARSAEAWHDIKVGSVVSFGESPASVFPHPKRPGVFVAMTVVGEVVGIDPVKEGDDELDGTVNVRVLWSNIAAFEVGEDYKVDGFDCLVSEDFTADDIKAFPPFEKRSGVSTEGPLDGELDDRMNGSFKVGGGLLLPEERPSLAQMMSAEIQAALGDETTPERCQVAIELTAAAHAFLTAQRKARTGHASGSSVTENLARLVQVFGIGADDNDPAP